MNGGTQNIPFSTPQNNPINELTSPVPETCGADMMMLLLLLLLIVLVLYN